MRFYTNQHRYYCGIDLHARSMYVCVLDPRGQILLHRNMPCAPESFLKAIAPYREDIAVAVECIFTWYWLADLCSKQHIPFVLGHALYMKAIHGGKAKNDKIDAHNMYLMRKRSELLAHVQNTNSQYNLPEIGKKIAYKANREGVAERFSDPSVQRSIEVDLKLIDHYDQLLTDLELYIVRTAKQHDAYAFYRLRSVPGIGKILALVILYEIHDINRFPTVQDFVSYSRLVKCAKESAGKRHGTSGKKIGNVHLKWAFSEASVLFLRANPKGQRFVEKLSSKHGKAKALSILAHKLGRAVYYMLSRKQALI